MDYISLNNSSLTYFTAKGELSKLSGSSKYNVFNNEIVIKEKPKKNKIENKSALQDYLQQSINDKTADKLFWRVAINYASCWQKCKREKFTSEKDLNRLELLAEIVQRGLYGGEYFPVKYSICEKNISAQQSRYQTKPRIKNTKKRLNKSKVKGKMFALFNLECSRKFIAFYSVSFPLGNSDEELFICWNYWLTSLRKTFGLNNYIWVTERQKNGTLHFHMLTNNYMPITQINRSMGIIINNRVLNGFMKWGNSDINRFNGVDVDSIFNSKRHKKTGKLLNPSEVRNWISKYVTKYVTKNTETFSHLCWHCSRSISILFTGTIILKEISRVVTDYLPRIRQLYTNFKGEFNDTWAFHFVPPEHLFDYIKLYNNLIFGEYVPNKIKIKNSINYKTTNL